jgi:2-polyprenyl-6-methoxyphenol hydroxylase-like FAD-dependent oxidoreductase
MGLTAAVRGLNTGETATTFMTSSGKIVASIPAGPNSPTSDLEIIRGDFAQLLYDETREHTEWIFGDQIAGYEERDGGVEVDFQKAGKREFDFVILADGIGSRTRKLVFGNEGFRLKTLGLCELAYKGLV